MADLGFYHLDLFGDLSAQGGYWLSRLQSNSRITLPGKRECSLVQALESLGPCAQWEGWVRVGEGGPLKARLLAQWVPQEVMDERRRRIAADAKEKGRAPAKAATALAAWNILITNVPEALLSLQEAVVIAAARWQIELMFKLWKSCGQVDAWRTDKPERILGEVYAKLIGMVLQHWMLLVSGWGDPMRSMVKAAQIIRDTIAQIARKFEQREALKGILIAMATDLQRLARTQKRTKKPSTAQRLLALTEGIQ